MLKKRTAQKFGTLFYSSFNDLPHPFGNILEHRFGQRTGLIVKRHVKAFVRGFGHQVAELRVQAAAAIGSVSKRRLPIGQFSRPLHLKIIFSLQDQHRCRD